MRLTKFHIWKWCLLFLTCMKLVVHVLACVHATAHIKWKRLQVSRKERLYHRWNHWQEEYTTFHSEFKSRPCGTWCTIPPESNTEIVCVKLYLGWECFWELGSWIKEWLDRLKKMETINRNRFFRSFNFEYNVKYKLHHLPDASESSYGLSKLCISHSQASYK